MARDFRFYFFKSLPQRVWLTIQSCKGLIVLVLLKSSKLQQLVLLKSYKSSYFFQFMWRFSDINRDYTSHRVMKHWLLRITQKLNMSVTKENFFKFQSIFLFQFNYCILECFIANLLKIKEV